MAVVLDVCYRSCWYSLQHLISVKRLSVIDGTVANCGVHGKPVEFDLDKLWIRNINVTTGLVSTNTTPQLLKALESHKIEPEKLVTHYFKLSEIEKPTKSSVRQQTTMQSKSLLKTIFLKPRY